MKNRFVLSIDLSSRECRSGIVTSGGKVLGYTTIPYPTKTENRSSNMLTEPAELDPESLINIIILTIKKSVYLSKLGSQAISHVSITGQRQATALLDKRKNTLYLGTNTDLRAILQGLTIDENHSDPIYKETGHLPSFFFTPAKLSWFLENEPKTFQQIATLCSLPAWVGLQLTGELIDEVSALGEMGVLDITNHRVAKNILSLIGISADILPDFARTEDTTQTISRKLSDLTGLLPSTKVQIAGPDTQVGLIGMEVNTPGNTGIVAGWSMPIQTVTTKPIFHPKQKTWVGYHVTNNTWVIESNTGDAGNAYQWVVGLLSENYNYAILEYEASQSAIGSGGVQSFLGPGSITFPNPQLTIGGILMPTPISFRKPTKGDIIRSALESISYAIKQSLSDILEVIEKPPINICLGGGLSQSKLFAQILSSVVERPVEVYNEHVSLIGAAYLSQDHKTTDFDALDSRDSKLGRFPVVVEPIQKDLSEYKELYNQWVSTLGKLEIGN